MGVCICRRGPDRGTALNDHFYLSVDYAVPVEIRRVDYYPSCDPMVYVQGRSMCLPKHQVEEVVGIAKANGWKVT